MKIIQNKIVIMVMPILFVVTLVWIYFSSNTIGIHPSEIRLLVANATLMLLATFIAISLPLYANTQAERQKKMRT